MVKPNVVVATALGTLPGTRENYGTMGKMPDKKPRKTPDRIYATVPDEEAARQITFTLKPFHLYVLDQLQNENGFSKKLQAMIEMEALNQGITQEEWQGLQDKSPYLKGVRPQGGHGRERKKKGG